MLSEQCNARRKKRHCCIFHRFCFALLLLHIFSCLPHSSRLSPSVSPLSVCLSFTLTSCCVHTVQCVLFLNEAVFSCSQSADGAEARPLLVHCGCNVTAHRQRNPEIGTWKRERERNHCGRVEIIWDADVSWQLNKDQIQFEVSLLFFFSLDDMVWGPCLPFHKTIEYHSVSYLYNSELLPNISFEELRLLIFFYAFWSPVVLIGIKRYFGLFEVRFCDVIIPLFWKNAISQSIRWN